MRIIIDQVFGMLGSHQTNPFLRIDVSHPQMKLHIEDPVLIVKHDRSELTINNREFLADLNMYEPLAFTREYAARAKGIVRDAIAEMADQGDRLGALESGADVFAAIAWEKGLDPAVDIQLAPLSLPRIQFWVVKGERSFQEGCVQVQLTPGQTQVDLEVGSARMYLRQNPELHVHTTGERLNVFC